MNDFSIYSGISASANVKKYESLEDVRSEKSENSASVKKVSGQTVGNPKLSEKAAKYYEELKKKYSNMNFVLVSADQKENAKANAASYANANNMVVLIDDEKIEKMANDEDYRKQIEGVISNAASGISQMAESLSATGANIKGYGIQVNDDGTTSFFAALEKSSAAQAERIQKKVEANRAAKKEAAKEANEERKEERLKKAKESDDTVTVTANSVEELIQKIQDIAIADRSDSVQTEQEKQVGQNFDFRG